MKNFVSVLAVIALTVTAASGQYSMTTMPHSGTYRATDASVTIKGYLIDERCAAAHMSSLVQTAVGHATQCCVKSVDEGLGLVYKGQWVPFDDKGSKKALDVIKKSDAPVGLMISVTGAVHGDRFVVSRIKEVKSIS